MKKIIFVAAVFIITGATQTSAQNKGSNYQTALGVKFYPGGGITLKHFVNNNAALEGIGYFWNDGMRITGLYEFHGNINGAPGLKWYAGPGAHIGFWNDKYWRREYGFVRRGNAIIGIDGVLGLDYKFKGAPINMSIDWQPSYEFGDYGGFYGNWGGFAIRYTFK